MLSEIQWNGALMAQVPHGSCNKRSKLLVSIVFHVGLDVFAGSYGSWVSVFFAKFRVLPSYVRFLSSLSSGCNGTIVAPSSGASSGSDAGWSPPDVRGGFLKNLIPQVQERASVELKVVNLTLESLLQFRDDHVEHTAHQAPPPQKLFGRRPNYNNRKRKLFAAQPIERKRHLSFHIAFHCQVETFDFLLLVWSQQGIMWTAKAYPEFRGCLDQGASAVGASASRCSRSQSSCAFWKNSGAWRKHFKMAMFHGLLAWCLWCFSFDSERDLATVQTS